MKSNSGNPFDITKATDFNDEQINHYWVGALGTTTFEDMAKPLSAMPMVILGGKGSGKTHIMRYFSFAVQKVRHFGNPLHGLLEDGYVGIYVRLSTLDGKRFQGKGFPEDNWSTVYAYYMELCLVLKELDVFGQLLQDEPERAQIEENLCKAIVNLFDTNDLGTPTLLEDLTSTLTAFKREADVAINNCFRTKKLDVVIRATPGNLIFGVPKAATSLWPALSTVRFLYLLDEFENILEMQQRYINTLIRERTDPSLFKVGSRLYGIKTLETISNESNVEGSEFEFLRLDEDLRGMPDNYNAFAFNLICSRLAHRQFPNLDALKACFEVLDTSNFYSKETKRIVATYTTDQRPYMKTFRTQLTQYKDTLGLNEESIESIMKCLQVPDYPLLEKLNLFLMYRAWKGKRNLLDEAKVVREKCSTVIAGGTVDDYQEVYKNFRSDLFAQLLRDCSLKQEYLGLSVFIHMSQGLPRNLLTILKHVYDWAVFRGERPFEDAPVSREAQREGLLEASDWFFRDARGPSARGLEIRSCTGRLAELISEIRFSDKPSEQSLSSVSMNTSKASTRSQEVIEIAKLWSLLIYIDEQRNKNGMRMDQKFQLISMIAPRWDLPIIRGGSLDLSPDEVNAIFDQEHSQEFENVRKVRSKRVNVPFSMSSGKNNSSPGSSETTQSMLFENEE